MPKPRNRIADYFVYLVVRLGVCIIQSLSPRQSLVVADALAWLAYRLDKRHRLAAAENLRYAFPDVTDSAAIDRRVRAVYRHFCRLLMEIVHLPRRLHTSNWRQYVELVGGWDILNGLVSNRPLMFLTGHFGNWELGGYTLGLLGFHTHAIARPLDNPYLDDFLRRFREHTGQKLLAKKGDFDQMQAILKNGGAIATLADQDAGQRGLFVDFFGRPASTHKAVALLSLEYQVPMIVIGVRKVGEPMRYQIVVEDVIYPEEYQGQPDAVRRMTERFTSALERIIRTAPEQYFWLHRRWKHQPAQRKGKKAA
ncbi:MAG: lysophospholipid acyltransferase family protein [Planctomycetia bacterium]|nr:lysophospholipid acyltransferase family protein [Planctomycetia bacterium]